MNKIRFFAEKGRGFTLVELLVVVAVIGLLASIVLAALNNGRKRGSDSRVISDIHQLKITLETNRLATGAYSVDLTTTGWQQTAGSSTNVNNLIADVAANGGTVTVLTGGNPPTAYLLYGGLPSQSNSKFYCVSSINSPDPLAPNNTFAPLATGSACP